MKLSALHKIRAAIATAVLVLLIGAVAVIAVDASRRASARALRTLELRKDLDAVLLQMRDAESVQRSFLITGDPGYLAPYDSAKAMIATGIARLRQPGSDIASVARIDSLAAMASARVALLDTGVRLRSDAGLPEAAAWVSTNRGRELMNRARDIVRGMETESEATLARDLGAARRSTLIALAVIALGSIAAFLLALFLNRALRRDVVAQQNMNEQLTYQRSQLTDQALALADQAKRLTTQAGELETQRDAANRAAREAKEAARQAREGAAALRESEQRFREMADTAPVLIWMADARKMCTYFNRPWLEFTGRPLEQQLGNGWTTVIHRDDLAACVTGFASAFDKRERFEMEYRVRRHDGEYRWLIDHGAPRYTESGEFVGFIGSCMDITDRKRAEDERGALAEAIPQMVWTARPDGYADYFNERWAEYTGQAPTQSEGWGWERVLHPEDLQRSLDTWTHSVRTGELYQIDYRLRRADGAYRWHLARGQPVRNDSGEIVRWFGTCTDIHDQKETERALTMNTRVIESMRDGVNVSNESGIIVYTNPAEDDLFGYAAGELAGKHVGVLNAYPPETNERIVAQVIQHLKTEGIWTGDWENVRKDGSTFATHSRITALQHDGTTYWVCVHEDVTERRAASARDRFLEQATALLSESLDFKDTLRGLTRHCVPFLADYCSVDMVTDEGEIVRVETAHRDPAKEPVLRDVWARYPYRAADRVGVPEVVRSMTPSLVPGFPEGAIEGFARSDEHLSMLRMLGPRSYICVPLVARGRAYGAISLVMSDSRRVYSDAELTIAIELARRAATAIDNARLYSAEHAARTTAEQASERTTRLQRVTAALARAVTVEDVARAIVTEGLAALGAAGATLAVLRDATFDVVEATGYAPELVEPWRHFPLSAQVPIAEAVRTRELVLLESMDERRRRFPGLAPSTTDAHKVLVAAPLLIGERALGAIGISYAEECTFTDTDREFLWTLATICAQAVERTQLYQAEQRALARTAFLSDATAVLTSSLDYETTLRQTADLAVPQLADWCAVDLIDRDGSIRRVVVAHRDPAKLALGLELTRRYPRDPNATTGVPNVLRTGTSELVPRVTDAMLDAAAVDAEHRARLHELGIRSLMIVPLTARGRTLGAMTFVASDPARELNEADLLLAEELARRAGLAVDNARLFQEAEEARAVATSANQAKSDFLATMSHEIRTPINAIVGYTQLLDIGIFGTLSEEQRTQLGRIAGSTQHLLGLVNEVLDLAKVESGTMALENEPALAGVAVDSALALTRPQGVAKGLSVSEQCGGARDSMYMGDEHRVRQVLTNLLANAVKFTDRGGRIDVRCSTNRTPPADSGLASSGPWIAFDVQDTGIGIDAAQLTRIFDPFTQAETGYTRERSGTGLGLTISRRLARLMGGDITVQSAPGIGSTFSLWMPAAGTAAEVTPATSPRRWTPVRSSGGTSSLEVAIEMASEHADPALAELGMMLVSSVRAIVDAWSTQARTEPELSRASTETIEQLEDHAATFLTDVGLALRTIGCAGADASDLMRDGNEILRLIAERHGAQRARLGWTEAELQAEMTLLGMETDAAIRTRATPAEAGSVERACSLVSRFFDQATRISRRAYRNEVETTTLP